MASIDLHRLSKRFPSQAEPAVDDLSLQVGDGELLVLLGPSGCGKTTTLRMIAGFERPQHGTIRIGDEVVASDRTWVPPERRGIGIVFQDYALFPHLTVEQNVAFGILKLPRRERSERVAATLSAVDLDQYADRYPHELSGGQQQRVALARAMAPQPRLLLLDEPFSNLDPELRSALRYEVRAIVRRAGITTVLVTHDQSEAFAMADRIAVMHGGRLHQLADPEMLYRRPASRFVAGFVGRAQFVGGRVGNGEVETELGSFPDPTGLPWGSASDVLLRPDDLHIFPDPHGEALVIEREFGGATTRYVVRLRSGELIDVIQPSAHMIALDSTVRVHVLPRDPIVFPAAGDRVSDMPLQAVVG
jgi:iron(III) transport system ATP-binding protein